MTDYEDEDWGDSPAALVSYGNPPVSMYQQVTTKIPPTFNGMTSWFAYEEAIDDWCDVTELEPEKRGPALRNRLEGEAAVYKPLLDRDQLRDAQHGVRYFKTALRPHFVKSSQSVFLWRFFQLFKAHRGAQDMLRWIGRLSVLRKRIGEAWMDLFIPVPAQDQNFINNVLRPLARQQLLANGIQPPGAFDPFQVLDGGDIEAALDQHNAQLRAEHMERFPISDTAARENVLDIGFARFQYPRLYIPTRARHLHGTVLRTEIITGQSQPSLWTHFTQFLRTGRRRNGRSYWLLGRRR